MTCHRALFAPLRAALAELSAAGSRGSSIGRLRRLLRAAADPAERPLSLHAWGLAVDLNAASNPFRGRSRQDPRLVRAMERHGFTWGGRWPTRPDPMHFELRG